MKERLVSIPSLSGLRFNEEERNEILEPHAVSIPSLSGLRFNLVIREGEQGRPVSIPSLSGLRFNVREQRA